MNSPCKETGRRRSNCRLAEEDQTELRIEIFQTFKQLYFSSHPWQFAAHSHYMPNKVKIHKGFFLIAAERASLKRASVAAA
jgi:hypothetical protein